MSDLSIPPTKRCTKCDTDLPLSEFYKRRPDKPWLSPWCKTCICRYKGNEPRPHYEDTDTEKQCRSCMEIKPRAEFGKWSKSKDGYKTQCKSCCAANGSSYYKANRIKVQEYGRQWNAKHKAKRCAYGQRGMNRRNARKRGLSDDFSTKDWQRCLDYFGNCCAVCGRPRGLWHKIAMDHWIPLSSPDCPGTVPSNIIPLCHGIDGCNNSKHDNDPIKWLTNKFGNNVGRKIANKIATYFNWIKTVE